MLQAHLLSWLTACLPDGRASQERTCPTNGALVQAERSPGTACPNGCDTLRTGFIIKPPSDAYNGKPISGELSIRMQKFRHSKKIKHVKYVMYLFDAAGNKSNVVTSPELFFN